MLLRTKGTVPPFSFRGLLSRNGTQAVPKAQPLIEKIKKRVIVLSDGLCYLVHIEKSSL